MVKHIVVWTLKKEASGKAKAWIAEEAKKRLEAFTGKIPGLRKLEVGINTGIDPGAADLLLYTEFSNFESLQAYQVHPLHKEFVDFIRPLRESRQVVDYEVK